MILSQVGQQRNLAVQHGNIDILALAANLPLCQSRKNANHSIQTRYQVTERDTNTHGPFTNLAGEAHNATQGLNNHIEGRAITVRPLLTKACNGTSYQARIETTECRIIYAQTRWDGRTHIIYHNI